MMKIGLTLHDLNFYDGSSEILISGMQHARQLQAAIDKVFIYFLFKIFFFVFSNKLSNMHGFRNYKQQKLNYKNGDEKENAFFIQ
jgi:hypothetical protein